jgi:hypothetical protein
MFSIVQKVIWRNKEKEILKGGKVVYIDMRTHENQPKDRTTKLSVSIAAWQLKGYWLLNDLIGPSQIIAWSLWNW